MKERAARKLSSRITIMTDIIDDVAAILGRNKNSTQRDKMIEMLNRHGFYFSRVTNDAPTYKEAKDFAIDISRGLDTRVRLEEQINKARAQTIGLNIEESITSYGWKCPACGAGNAPTTAAETKTSRAIWRR
jgi:hypothetical protein